METPAPNAQNPAPAAAPTEPKEPKPMEITSDDGKWECQECERSFKIAETWEGVQESLKKHWEQVHHETFDVNNLEVITGNGAGLRFSVPYTTFKQWIDEGQQGSFDDCYGKTRRFPRKSTGGRAPRRNLKAFSST